MHRFKIESLEEKKSVVVVRVGEKNVFLKMPADVQGHFHGHREVGSAVRCSFHTRSPPPPLLLLLLQFAEEMVPLYVSSERETFLTMGEGIAKEMPTRAISNSTSGSMYALIKSIFYLSSS